MENHIDSLNKRVERVEGKIDDMFEVMIAMARAEEKLTNIAGSLDDIRKENARLIEKIDVLEDQVAVNEAHIATYKRISFALLSAIISLAVSVITGVL